MRLYLASRRWPYLVAGVALIALSSVVNTTALAFPSIIGGGGGSVLSLSASTPLLLAIAFAWSLAARRTHLSSGASRATGWMDALLLLALGTTTWVVIIVVHRGGGDIATVRNTLILNSLVGILIPFSRPETAAAITTGVVLAVLTYGSTAPGARFIRILQAEPNATWPLAVSIALTCISAILLTVDGSSRPRWRSS